MNKLVFEKVKIIQKNFRIYRIPENYGNMDNFRFLTWKNYCIYGEESSFQQYTPLYN